jgi:hypothetical protein
MIKYKLTTQEMMTYGGFQWEIGKTVKTDGKEKELCNCHWLHYYHDPLLAIFFNPIHADIKNPLLWKVEATRKNIDDNGIKGGCTRMKLIKQIPVPEVTIINRVAFGIYCSLAVCDNVQFGNWAKAWLSGEDRAAAHAAITASAAAHIASAAAHAAAYAEKPLDLISIAKKAMLIK